MNSLFRTAVAALVLLVFGLAGPQAAAQPQAGQQPNVQAQTAALQNLDFLVGDWRGEGWMATPGGRLAFVQTEAVQFRLNGLVLEIEGHGFDPEDGSTVFQALAFIRYDEGAEAYSFHSYSGGRVGTFSARLVRPRVFEWLLTMPGRTIRYTIIGEVDDVWHEIGETSVDGGATWLQIFEMTLRRTRRPEGPAD